MPESRTLPDGPFASNALVAGACCRSRQYLWAGQELLKFPPASTPATCRYSLAPTVAPRRRCFLLPTGPRLRRTAPRVSARVREGRRQARAARQPPLPRRPRHPRRARLPAVLTGGRGTALPSAQPPLRAHQRRGHHQPELLGAGQRVRRPEDDHRAARSVHPSLPHRRDWQRQLPLQEQLNPSREEPRTQKIRPTLSHTVAHRGGSWFDAKPGSAFGVNQHRGLATRESGARRIAELIACIEMS